MLLFEKDEVEMIPAGTNRCSRNCGRQASWSLVPLDGGDRVPFCGWCALYDGSKWGHDNRDELAYSGELCKAQALKSPKGRVPQLDQQHRLGPIEADRYMHGIVFTSFNLHNGGSLSRLMSMGVRVRSDSDE